MRASLRASCAAMTSAAGQRREEGRARLLRQLHPGRVEIVGPLEEIQASRRRAAVVVAPDADLRDFERPRHDLGHLSHDRREVVGRARIAAHQRRERGLLSRVALVHRDDFGRGALPLGDVQVRAVDPDDTAGGVLLERGADLHDANRSVGATDAMLDLRVVLGVNRRVGLRGELPQRGAIVGGHELREVLVEPDRQPSLAGRRGAQLREHPFIEREQTAYRHPFPSGPGRPCPWPSPASTGSREAPAPRAFAR